MNVLSCRGRVFSWLTSLYIYLVKPPPTFFLEQVHFFFFFCQVCAVKRSLVLSVSQLVHALLLYAGVLAFDGAVLLSNKLHLFFSRLVICVNDC